MNGSRQVVVTGAFNDLRVREFRLLEEAARFGSLTVLLWPDEAVRAHTGKPPKFPFAEREYVLKAVRYVAHVLPAALGTDGLPSFEQFRPDVWVDEEALSGAARRAFCERQKVQYRVIPESQLKAIPETPTVSVSQGRKRVVVTGCYDWLHSGHVRFFEEASTYGDLYVIVGHDANIRLLKGDGHPLLSEQQRRYAVGSIKYVKQALIGTGNGWLDAEPEIQRLQPDFYVVNEDGDKGGKQEYCATIGVEYLVLKRVPAPGLERRSSTELRGF